MTGVNEYTWEVAITNTRTARRVQRREVRTAELPQVWSEVLRDMPDGFAILITRTDKTPEALKAKWEADFYDIDKSGRRRRRYRKTQIEREWEEFFATQKRELREAKARGRAKIAREKPEWNTSSRS